MADGMINYFYDCYTILGKVYGEGAYLKQAILSAVIEEKNRALTVKTCYGVLDKDIELSYYIKKLTEKTPKLAIRTILKRRLTEKGRTGRPETGPDAVLPVRHGIRSRAA